MIEADITFEFKTDGDGKRLRRKTLPEQRVGEWDKVQLMFADMCKSANEETYLQFRADYLPEGVGYLFAIDFVLQMFGEIAGPYGLLPTVSSHDNAYADGCRAFTVTLKRA